jgi:hypothetical protein
LKIFVNVRNFISFLPVHLDDVVLRRTMHRLVKIMAEITTNEVSTTNRPDRRSQQLLRLPEETCPKM